MISQKPYLIRAMFEWCNDNNFTPYISVHVDENVQVPKDYVHDHQIVLDIAYSATRDFKIDNDWILFKATFDGEIEEISIPINYVKAIFAKENGIGMQFEIIKELPEGSNNKTVGSLKLVK